MSEDKMTERGSFSLGAARFYGSIINKTCRKHKTEVGELVLLNNFLEYISNLFPSVYIT